MTLSPKVSIIIPVYNGENFLCEAVNSALDQTYDNIEIIVINDGSSDYGKTEAIAQSYGNKIKYYTKLNGGVSSALNFGIEKMTGDFFSWLSHDDVYFPEKIARQVSLLEKHGNDVIVYSDFDYIDEYSQYIQTKRVQKIDPTELRFCLMDKAPVVHGCATLIPKSCFFKVGFFNESLKVVQDIEMWLRLSREFEFIHLPEALIHSRLHVNQGSKHLTTELIQENVTFLNSYFDEIANEANNAVVVKYLLNGAITLIHSSFPDSAEYAYKLAIRKIQANPIRNTKYFSLLAIFWISQQPFWRFLRVFTVIPYRNLKKHFFNFKYVQLQKRRRSP